MKDKRFRIVFLLLGIVFIWICLQQYQVQVLRDDLNNIVKYVESKKTSEVPNLKSLDYYKENQIISLSELENIKEDEYLVYIHQDGCGSCEVSNEFVSVFIIEGYTNDIPLYFINLSEIDFRLPLEYEVEATPSLVIFTQGKLNVVAGVEFVFQRMDEYVNRIK